jgi:enoyl-CoA hydratase
VTDELLVERNEGITRLTLNRPEKANALSATLVDALISSVDIASGDDTYLLILQGSGRMFSGGFDLANLDQESDGSLVERFIRIETLLQNLYHAPFSTLALAHGAAFGAGADLVCVCEQRIATPATVFRMPGLQFGVVLGTRRFAQRVGPDTARAILGESRAFNAEQGLEMGFLTGVAGESAWTILEDGIAEVGQRLDTHSRVALNAATVADTRAEDMTALQKSVKRPGLKERIEAYVAKFVTRRGKSD